MTDTVLDTASTNDSLNGGGDINAIDAVPESGSFDTTLDHDWFAVTLAAGHDYTFSAQGISGSLNDVAIDLRDSSRTILNSQGVVDAGANAVSSFTFTATSSGTAYLDVSAGGNNPASQTGQYLINFTDIGTDTVLDTAATSAGITATGAASGTIDAVPESGSFNTSLDHDWFAVSLIAGHHYIFEARATSGNLNDLAIDLRDSSRSILNSQGVVDSGANPIPGFTGFTYTATSSGTAYLDICAGGNNPASLTGGYTISAFDNGADPDTVLDTASTNDSLNGGGDINAIDAVPESGSFDTTLDHDWFAVSLAAGHDYTFSAQGISGSLNDVAIDLRDSSRTILNSQGVVDAGANATSSFTYTATSSGTAYLDISAGGNNPASQTGQYLINFTDIGADTVLDTASTDASLTAGDPNSGRISGVPEDGSFDTSRDHDWFAVTLAAGHDYIFSAQGISGSLNDVAIDLRNSNRTILNSQGVADAGANATSSFTYTATSSGTAYLDVSAGGNSPASLIGDYQITVTDIGADTVLDTASTNASLLLGMGQTTAGTINGVPESGSFDTSLDHDWFTVNLTAGHVYTFSAQGTSGSLNDVAIDLRDSGRTILDSQGVVDAGADAASSFTYTATSSGTAYLDIGAGGNNPASLIGNYQINVTDNGLAPPPHLIINLVYDANAIAAPQSFRDAMRAAADMLESAFSDKIVINIAVGYGEFGGVTLSRQNISEGNIGYTGDSTSGKGITESYSDLRTLLLNHETSADDITAVNSLPNTPSLQGRSSFVIGTAQAKALGAAPPTADGIDGQVGMGTSLSDNTLIQAALHELTHAMGRVDGDSLDLFRFNENRSGNRVFGSARPATPAYFSIDGGATDLADFGITSDPGDFLNSGVQGADPFDEFFNSATSLSSTDLQLMDVLGFQRNPPPVVTASDVTLSRGTSSVAMGSLFTASDQDGDTITQYRFWDGTADPSSGHVAINGVAQGKDTYIPITAAQLAQTTFQAGSVTDQMWVQANDGTQWGAWTIFNINPPADRPPVVTAPDVTLPRGTSSVAMGSLFTTSDPDGDPIAQYRFWAGTADPSSGQVVVNGVAQGKDSYIPITAGQLAQTSFQAGSASDQMWVQAFDGAQWSAWTIFNINPPFDRPPVITASDATLPRGTSSVAMSSLFTTSDPDNDPITQYRFWDGTADPNSGHVVVNGVVQGKNSYIPITAAQLAQTTFQAGTASDQMWVQANDGTQWSAWTIFNINPPVDRPPVITASDVTLPRGRSSVAMSSLFNTSDPDGDAIAQYRFWDGTSDPNSGNVVVNGVVQGKDTYIPVTAGQLAQTTFQAGAVSDQMWVQAFDGAQWSAWTIFNINPPIDHPPVVIASDVTLPHGTTSVQMLGGLFTVVDPDGDTITQYRLWDGTADPNSGHVVVNGMAQGKNTYIALDNSPSSVQTTFQAGTVPDQMWVQAFDGSQWGAWTIFNINPPANHPPTVVAGDVSAISGQVLQASNLLTASDPDGDTITQYRFWDGTADSNSGHMLVNGVAQGKNAYIPITAGQLAQTTFQVGTISDQMWVQAFDGAQWGAWTIFNINPAAGGYQAPATVANGATLELTSAYSGTVTFAGPAGTLKLDQSASFTGKIGGQLASGDVIDLADITAGAGATIGYSGNNSPGTLTVSDGIRTASIALLGNYAQSNFTPSSDGHGGTSVADPPLVIAGGLATVGGPTSSPGPQIGLLVNHMASTFTASSAGLIGFAVDTAAVMPQPAIVALANV